MVIAKTSETSVRCDITALELEQLELLPQDIMEGRTRAGEFLEKLNEEVGKLLEYEPAENVIMYSYNLYVNGNLRIDALKLNNDHIAEAANKIRKSAEGILRAVSEDVVQNIIRLTGIEKAEALQHMIQDVSDYMNSVSDTEESQTAVQPANGQEVVIVEHCSYIANFDSLNKVMKFCQMMKDYPIQDARLYKNKDIYYLFFDIDITDEGMLYEIQTIGIEYANEIQINPLKKSYIEENGECIVKKDVIKSLGSLTDSKEEE